MGSERVSSAELTKNLRDFLDRVPIARGDRSRSNRSRVSQHRGNICVLSNRGKVGLVQCADEVRTISQVVSKMCFGGSGSYSNGKIDQADGPR